MRPLRLALAGALLVLVVVLAVRGAGRFLVVADPLPTHADAIVMLAGSLSDRVLETAHLYHTGVAPVVILTRIGLRPAAVALRERGVRVPEEHDLARAALIALGVPAHAIRVLARRAQSTRTEARAIARWACRHGVRRLVVVTSPTHTRRARLILARTLGPDIALSVQPAPAEVFPAKQWWRHRRAMKDVLVEYEKLVAYWLVERWTIEPCGGLRTRRASARLDGLPDHGRQLALRVQLAHDVAAADELAPDEDLRDGRPARVRLDALSLVGLGEDVYGLERHADLVQHLDRGGGEAAHREPRRPLHVDHDRVALHFLLDLGHHVAHRAPSSVAC